MEYYKENYYNDIIDLVIKSVNKNYAESTIKKKFREFFKKHESIVNWHDSEKKESEKYYKRIAGALDILKKGYIIHYTKEPIKSKGMIKLDQISSVKKEYYEGDKYHYIVKLSGGDEVNLSGDFNYLEEIYF